MKLYERSPPLSLAKRTGPAPIGEHPAREFAIAQPTAPGRDVGRIWHIPVRELFDGVAATSARHAWAVGSCCGAEGRIFHWNGTAWK